MGCPAISLYIIRCAGVSKERENTPRTPRNVGNLCCAGVSKQQNREKVIIITNAGSNLACMHQPITPTNYIVKY